MTEKVRLDKWLWAARFFKTRALARDAIKGGKVQLNGVRVKPGRVVALGDELIVRRGEDEYRVTVKDTDDRRLSAAFAAEKYEEDPAARVAREAAIEQRKLEFQARKDRPRRPDKRQRREIVRFTKTSR